MMKREASRRGRRLGGFLCGEEQRERERERQTDIESARAQRKAGSVGCWFGLLDSLEGGMGCAEVAKIPSREAGIDS